MKSHTDIKNQHKYGGITFFYTKSVYLTKILTSCIRGNGQTRLKNYKRELYFTDFDECIWSPCGGGKCTDLLSDYNCTCYRGWLKSNGSKKCDEGIVCHYVKLFMIPVIYTCVVKNG